MISVFYKSFLQVNLKRIQISELLLNPERKHYILGYFNINQTLEKFLTTLKHLAPQPIIDLPNLANASFSYFARCWHFFQFGILL